MKTKHSGRVKVRGPE